MDESSFLCIDQTIRNLAEAADELSRLGLLGREEERLCSHANVMRFYASLEKLQQLVMNAQIGAGSITGHEKTILQECVSSLEAVSLRMHESTRRVPEQHRSRFRDALFSVDGVAAVLKGLLSDGWQSLTA
jgi:hypothetical protein